MAFNQFKAGMDKVIVVRPYEDALKGAQSRVDSRQIEMTKMRKLLDRKEDEKELTDHHTNKNEGMNPVSLFPEEVSVLIIKPD